MHGLALTETTDHQIDHMGVHIEVNERIQSLFQGEQDGARCQNDDVKSQNRGSKTNGEAFQEYNMGRDRISRPLSAFPE